MAKKVIIQGTEKRLDAFFKVNEATLSFEKYDGSMSEPIRRLNFERGDAVAAILYDEQNRVTLVEQFRYPSFTKGDGWITEVVAGIVMENEDPVEAIQREILEESGYAAKAIEHISTFYVSPGGSSERIFLYGVEIRKKDKVEEGGGIADEDVKVIERPLDDWWKDYQNGKILDAKTIVALTWLKMK